MLSAPVALPLQNPNLNRSAARSAVDGMNLLPLPLQAPFL
jgi:hypothetical protein